MECVIAVGIPIIAVALMIHEIRKVVTEDDAKQDAEQKMDRARDNRYHSGLSRKTLDAWEKSGWEG
jgi:hypothetical protein